MLSKDHFKIAITKAAVILAPSYVVAFLTDKMVYVVPTVAAAALLASSLTPQTEYSRRVEEDEASLEIDIESGGS